MPMLPWVGGFSPSMNLKDCYMGCLMIDMVEKETDLTIGIVEGQVCLCGHAFDASSNVHFILCISKEFKIDFIIQIINYIA